MKKSVAFSMMVALAAIACGKEKSPDAPAPYKAVRDMVPIPEPAPKPVTPPPGFDKLSPAEQASWRKNTAEVQIWEEECAKYRAKVVRPAPPGFNPGKAARKFKLTLTPKSTVLRRGESFWYIAEFQNVGREPIDFSDHFFFAQGDNDYIGRGEFRFVVIGPDDKPMDLADRRRIDCPPHYRELSMPGWEHKTDAEKREDFRVLKLRTDARRYISLRMQPGERLVTMPWAVDRRSNEQICADGARGETYVQAVSGPYRELWGGPEGLPVGTSRIKLMFSDMRDVAGMPTEDEIHKLEKQGVSRDKQLKHHREYLQSKLGTVESNVVKVEVRP